MVGREGYPVETHQVVTEDGYILRMHRIPHGKRSPRTEDKRPAVYIQHGLTSSSKDWLVAGPKKALGKGTKMRTRVNGPFDLRWQGH